MAPRKLAEITVLYIEFMNLVGDEILDPDTACSYVEGIAGILAEATEEEREAVKAAARERLAWLLQGPDEYGYSPRKLVTPEQRKVLEGIASWEAFDGPPEAKDCRQ
ncbi:MAG TPA: hypothetical protein VHM90_14230 [Phycisphaerae bacterium]|nr:hypothetical protein [Phycisphaerae bacterium]